MKRSILGQVVILMLLADGGSISAASRREPLVPEALVAELFDDELSPRDREYGSLLGLLARDPRPSIRARVASWSVSMWFERPAEAEALLGALAADRASEVRAAAARGLGLVAAVAGPFERLRLVSEWAIAAEPARRAALAVALRYPFASPAVPIAIAHLARDPDRAIAGAALDAARRRVAEDPGYRALLAGG